MPIENKNDVKENVLKAVTPRVLKILLKDKSKEYIKHKIKDENYKTNIIWATNDYESYGDGYSFSDEITIKAITGKNGNIIRPRIEKSKCEQTARAKDKAEVFTPSWVCNKQNNLIDTAWFGQDNIFNTETENGWITNTEKIVFPNTKGKTWQDYVKANRLEVSCGEAPYITSRYDTVTGNPIPVPERIGLLDRKLRVVSENTDSELEWILWAKKAVQSVYGFEWQGDNVLLARENVLYAFAEYYEYKFGFWPIKEYMIEFAKVVVWNIWQMDGIKFVVPNSCYEETENQLNMFGYVVTSDCPGCAANDHSKHNGVYCRIYDWSANKSVEFYSFVRRRKNNGKV